MPAPPGLQRHAVRLLRVLLALVVLRILLHDRLGNVQGVALEDNILKAGRGGAGRGGAGRGRGAAGQQSAMTAFACSVYTACFQQ